MLVNLFISRLSTEQSPWGLVTVAAEFDYQRGRTDIVAQALDSALLEAKLNNWRSTLHQAFRNRCLPIGPMSCCPRRSPSLCWRRSQKRSGYVISEKQKLSYYTSKRNANFTNLGYSRRAIMHIEAAGAREHTHRSGSSILCRERPSICRAAARSKKHSMWFLQQARNKRLRFISRGFRRSRSRELSAMQRCSTPNIGRLTSIGFDFDGLQYLLSL